ncbi:phe13-bombesin receptor-like [Lytechinus pictus]|uniref:phe13-bombesin receptor-like n=1 Tax=Lytechinus pictus TaxID=7653 RepID=UPI0030B9DF5E
MTTTVEQEQFNITDDGETTTPFFPVFPEEPINVAYVVVLFVELFIGVPANASLIFLVARVRELRTAPNLLLANLAVGDLIFLFASIPVSISQQLKTYESSITFCRFQHGVYYISFAVSALSLTVISLERYGAIVKPFTLKSVRESRSTVIICVIIWIVSILLFGIYPMYLAVPNFYYKSCTMPYLGKPFRTYFVLQLVLLYLVPLFCMTTFYAFCTRELLRKRRILGQRSTGRGNSDRSRSRVAFNLMLITFLFALCWLPNYVYYLWFLFVRNLESFRSPIFVHLKKVRSVFYYLASCINPMILYAMSTSFRHHLIATMTCAEKKSARTRNGYCNRETQRSVTLKSTIRIPEQSTRLAFLRMYELKP